MLAKGISRDRANSRTARARKWLLRSERRHAFETFSTQPLLFVTSFPSPMPCRLYMGLQESCKQGFVIFFQWRCGQSPFSLSERRVVDGARTRRCTSALPLPSLGWKRIRARRSCIRIRSPLTSLKEAITGGITQCARMIGRPSTSFG